MNKKALLQLGSELLFQVRHSNFSADRVKHGYFRERRFLGSRDRDFLSTCVYTVLRNLRRYDEAILSGFSLREITEPSFTAGFPITSGHGAHAWERDPNRQFRERQRFSDRAVDTIRLGLAALEHKLMPAEDIGAELERCWPKPENEAKMPLTAGALTRMMERSAEVAALFANSKKPIELERTHSFPSWLWGFIVQGRDIDRLNDLGQTLNGEAALTLRVNTLRRQPEQALEILTAAGIHARQSERLPECLVLGGRVATGKLAGLEEGWLEVQDEGSQLISRFAAPQAGQTIIDACAGGGGKTLHLGALMENKGRLIAMDRDTIRLDQLDLRARRAGVTIVERDFFYNGDDSLPGNLPAPDMVLIDSPCSGTGTIRRTPEIRWKLSQTFFQELLQTQAALLNRWAEAIPMGGLLVYATCSLLAEENEHQVERFLAAHPNFERDQQQQPWGKSLGILNKQGDLRVDPLDHGTDGLYAARLRRTR